MRRSRTGSVAGLVPTRPATPTAYDRSMRRSRATARLALLGTLLLSLGPSAAGTSPNQATSPSARATAPSEPAGTPVRWRLSAASSASRARVVEIITDGGTMVAFRTGTRPGGVTATQTRDERVVWDEPAGDAVALHGSWWSLARPVQPVVPPQPDPARLTTLRVDVVDATTGDADGDGTDEVVVVFRRPFRETVVSGLLPGAAGTDGAGRSLHLGLYGAGLTQEWVAGTVFRPVSTVAACDGALALGFADSVSAAHPVTATHVAAGASFWGGFGFTSLPGIPDLPGPGDPACADVDGDGRTEPLVIHRSGRTPP